MKKMNNRPPNNPNPAAKRFILVIKGYSRDMYPWSPEEKYHIHALRVAKSLGFSTHVLIQYGKVNLCGDPDFDQDTEVIDCGGAFGLFRQVLAVSSPQSLFYVNSYEWESFVIPFLVRRSVFMAHTQPKRSDVIRQMIQNFAYRFFTAIRLNNETEKAFLLGQGIAVEKLSVVPLVVSQDTYRIENPESMENAAMPVRRDIAYFGNVTAKKNLPTIIRAFESLKSTHRDIRFHIIGKVHDESVFKLIDASLHKKDIVLHGFLSNDDARAELNKMLVYVNSSTDEGQCVAAYDAALCGCVLALPKIMSFVGVFKDCALFHDIYDHEQLAGNLRRYLDDAETAELHRVRAIEMIRSEYSIATVERKMKELFTYAYGKGR
jgi:glycosyltransferase involved in cell wall biosynthesis